MAGNKVSHEITFRFFYLSIKKKSNTLASLYSKTHSECFVRVSSKRKFHHIYLKGQFYVGYSYVTADINVWTGKRSFFGRPSLFTSMYLFSGSKIEAKLGWEDYPNPTQQSGLPEVQNWRNPQSWSSPACYLTLKNPDNSGTSLRW